jgi:hypothetical protein
MQFFFDEHTPSIAIERTYLPKKALKYREKTKKSQEKRDVIALK